MLLLFLLNEESFLPQIVVCPPTSLRPMRQFSVKLTSRAVPLSSVIVRLALTTDKNSQGITYSKISPSIVGRLNNDERANIQRYIDNLQDAWEQEGVKNDDYEATEFDPNKLENE